MNDCTSVCPSTCLYIGLFTFVCLYFHNCFIGACSKYNCISIWRWSICSSHQGCEFCWLMCPPPVAAYQKYMSGVDICMQHLAKNPVGRPSKKYWKFFLNFIMEVCLIYAFDIFTRTPNKDIRLKTRHGLLDFRMEVV